jgi:ribose transport system substrate-binding protein
MAAFAAIGVAGCSGGDSSKSADAKPADTSAPPTPGGGTQASGGKKDLTIAMIAKSSNNPVFGYAQTGANAAADELGKKNGINIKINWLTPNEESPTEQAQRIAQAVNDGADAILISCSDAAKVTTAINDAVARNVPVMTFDSDAPASKRFAFYGTDDEACGKEVMDELGAATGGKGNYAILAGTQTAPNLQKRVKGAEDEAAAKFPNMKLVTVAYHKETPADASAKVTQVMNANPQIDAWAMVGGWPLFATSLLNTLDPKKVKIVSVDALPQELPYVEKGITPVLLAQPCYNWGYTSVGIIVDKLVLHKDVPVINPMPLVKVTKDNLGDWAKEMQDKWGAKGIDPKYIAMAKK